MVKLDRYIGVTVFVAILAVLGVILGLALLFAFIDELNDISASYGIGEALRFIALTAPRRAYDMLPMAALIGCLVGLGTLASNSELTIMRAAGVSLSRIVWAVMKPMLVLMLAGILVGEYVAPWTENIAQSGRALAQGGGDSQSSSAACGIARDANTSTSTRCSPMACCMALPATASTSSAGCNRPASPSARVSRPTIGNWKTSPPHCCTHRRNAPRWSSCRPNAGMPETSPQLLNTVVMEPEALSISGLWQYIHYLADQGLNNNRYWLAFWTKVLQPLVTAALVLMAISFIFGPLRSVTLGQRIFTGVLVGFVFRIAQDLLGPSSLVFDFPPLLAVVIPASACALAGLWLLRRAG